jgi:UDP-N-acetylglucosamine--N-acetylmuramyl-(pentapeptide) pyrophosphoryl-undecaprenol N-acetylglucosamine transferase
MTFLIAAAGTGGHVFPGLAVGEALVDKGVPRTDILFVGGSRLEARVYPEEGFPFLELDIRGLRRSLSPGNLGLPLVYKRARDRVALAMGERAVTAVLGMGGYVTIPVGMAARKLRVPFFNSEQNANAGLANRVAARWARKTFGSFPETAGLPGAEWVGNPVREPFWHFDRDQLRAEALSGYGLQAEIPTLGVVGGSLGAGVINRAVVDLVTSWDGPPIQVVHLTGDRFYAEISAIHEPGDVTWARRGFEPAMEMFYAVSDLVVTRAGGAVAELTATGTPSILVPGDFGSGGHQSGNARYVTEAGAAVAIAEPLLDEALADVVRVTLLNPETLSTMRLRANRIAKPRAAHTIAEALIASGL